MRLSTNEQLRCFEKNFTGIAEKPGGSNVLYAIKPAGSDFPRGLWKAKLSDSH